MVVAVILFGFLDWKSGYEFNFFAIYFAPIAFCAWHVNFGSSMFLAVLSALVWSAADFLSGHVYSQPFFAVWNTALRLVSYLVLGWSVSRIRELLDKERRTAEELRRSLSEVKVLEAFLPICAWCKRIKNRKGEWQQLEAYIGEHSETKFSHGFCPECARKAMKEAGFLENGNEKGR